MRSHAGNSSWGDDDSTMRHPLNISHEQDHGAVLARWRWFRDNLVALHDLDWLPAAFTPEDGELSKNTRVDEDDPRYDQIPCEFNYNWRCQTLTFAQDGHTVTVTVNRDDHVTYHWFAHETAARDSQVKLFVGTWEQYLELGDGADAGEAWLALILHPSGGLE